MASLATQPKYDRNINIPPAVAEKNTDYGGYKRDDQIDNLLHVFLRVLSRVPWKNNTRVGERNEEEKNTSADAHGE